MDNQPNDPSNNQQTDPLATQTTQVNSVSPPAGGPSDPVSPILPPNQSAPTRPKKSKRLLVVLLIVLLLLGGGGLAYWFVNRNVSEDSSAVVETKEVEQVRVGSTDGPANNLYPKEGIGISYTMNRQVYEGLVASQDGKYVPLLASSWTNPDEKTWLFKLKPDVKFHTGKALTASDVKSSIEALQKLDFLGYITSTIDTVEVVSDNEVKITTKEPDALLLNRLAIAFITDASATDAEGNDGTGPYTLDKTATFDENNATLVANDNYHQGRPKTRKIVYQIFEDDQKMKSALQADQIDVMDTIPDADVVEGLDEAGFAKIEFESPGNFGLYMNMLKEGSPLKNVEVRKALAQALNRKALVEELDNNNLPASQVIPKSLPGYDSSLAFPEFNAPAAKETLSKAGYPNGVTLEYVYIKDIQPDPPIIIKQLEEAGFTIKASSFTEVDTVLDKVFDGDFDLFSAAYTSDLADSRDLLGALLHSTEQSYPIYTDENFDKILENSDKELDPTKRITILQEANKYVTDNLLWIPLRSTAYVSYYKPELDIKREYNGGGSLGVYFWKVGEKVTN